MSGIRVPQVVMRLGARQIGKRVLSADLPWEVQRRRLDTITKSPLPRGACVTERGYGGVNSEVITAAGVPVDASRAIVHFHGGGYCVGSAQVIRAWAAGISARTGSRVILPQYRLAPEHPHPAALEDARAVMDALFAGISASDVVMSGDSAGGGLALALIMALRDTGHDLPAGCVLLSPWLDLSRDWQASRKLVAKDAMLSPRWLEACAAAYTGSTRRTDPQVSPLLGTQAGLPPLLIQAGTDELLMPDAERLAAQASEAGVDVTYSKWPRMWHDFELQVGQLAAADSALTQAAWFIERVTRAAS